MIMDCLLLKFPLPKQKLPRATAIHIDHYKFAGDRMSHRRTRSAVYRGFFTAILSCPLVDSGTKRRCAVMGNSAAGSGTGRGDSFKAKRAWIAIEFCRHTV